MFLSALGLRWCQLQDGSLEALGRLTHLRELDLSRGPLISDKTLLAVGSLTNLVALNLTWGFPGHNMVGNPSRHQLRYSTETLRAVISVLPHLAILNLPILEEWVHLSIGSLLRIATQPCLRPTQNSSQEKAMEALEWVISTWDAEELATEVEASPVGIAQLVELLESSEGGGAAAAGEIGVRSRAAVLLQQLFGPLGNGPESLWVYLRGRPSAVRGLVSLHREGRVRQVA